METLGPAGDALRLAQHYRQLTDDELLDIARDRSDLTEAAQQALGLEVSQRKLKLEPEEAAPDPEPSDSSDEADPYTQDREPVELCTVWSVADALQVESLLNVAGIPFFIGTQKATEVNAGTLNFAEGVSVKVMNVGLSWAQRVLQKYIPADEPKREPEPEPGNMAIHCPRCHSEEVVFEELLGEPTAAKDGASSKFRWKCDSCGLEWEDEGIVTED